MATLLLASQGAAQRENQPALRPAFDVASVKVADETSPATTHGGPGTRDPGRITIGRCDLIYLLSFAYGMQRDQIIGPGTRLSGYGLYYTITATMPRDTTKEQFRVMLQDLLAERFHLAIHHETKPFPGYELTGAAGGQKMKLDSVQEDIADPEVIAEIARGPIGKDQKGFPVLPPGLPWRIDNPRMGTIGTIRGSFHVSMSKFLECLPYMIIHSLQVPAGAMPVPRVVDRTGLNGVYDFTLEFVGGALLSDRAVNSDSSTVPVAGDPSFGGGGGPTLFEALEKQLGLTLKKIKDIQVDMLVVDHADKIPASN